MNMGSMSNLPSLEDFPTFYYAVVGAAIGVATAVNVYNQIIYRQRLCAVLAGDRTAARPKSWLAQGVATTYALTREASNFSIRIPLKDRYLRLPTVGRFSLIAANMVVLVVLCLYGLDLQSVFTREDVGFRCGVITISQLPLIFLLSGKNNIIGCLTGISYERLNWLHRWCARSMLLTATLHMGYFFGAWAPYDYIGYQLQNNAIVWKGVAAWSTLVWIVFSSMTPIRGWSYEFFVVQHVISFALLLAFAYIHTPVEMNAYIWIPVALFFFDRLFRLGRLAYANLSIFHSSQKQQNQAQGLWACKAEFVPLPHDATRIIIHNPPIRWKPGQHVFLSCQSVVPLQNHPFTIASIPEDGRMEFVIKAEKGGTRRFFRHAEKSHASSTMTRGLRTVAIEGPYGCIRTLRQFDSVVLIAGSTGATFTYPLLRDIVQGWTENSSGAGLSNRKRSMFGKQSGAVTRHVRFVWVVKSRGQLGYFSEQLSSVWNEFQTLHERVRDIKLEVTVYITCDDAFTEEHKSLLSTLTAPNTSTEKAALHETVQYRGTTPSNNEASKIPEEKGIVREISNTSSPDGDEQQACAPAGTCCCKKTIDENTTTDTITQCCCRPSTSRPVSDTSSQTPSFKRQPLIHPSITVYSGRPKTRDIIRRSLEQALGESAVVVCGPQGLVTDVKHDVCSLSDERAVHKGTGAQGIYLHTESFSY